MAECRPVAVYKSKCSQLCQHLVTSQLIDMIGKVILFGLLATTALAMPIGPDDDIPTYTEKVTPEKPTQVPKFGTKKLQASSRKASEQLHPEQRQPHGPPPPTTLLPKATLKTSKPIRGSSRPVRRPNKGLRKPNPLYNDLGSTNDYNAPAPVFVPAQELGVEYASDSSAPESHDDYGLVDDYQPRRAHRRPAEAPRAEPYRASAPTEETYRASAPPEEPYRASAPLKESYRASAPPEEPYRASAPPKESYRASSPPKERVHQIDGASDYGSAVGNAPQLRYAIPPERFASAAAQIKDVPDYGYTGNSYEDKPQPYVFGYELKDENGSTQSRKEEGDDYGNKRGSYGYTDGYGIYRQVDYVADAHGFRAVIKTNEPGTENQDPADVQMQSEAAKY